MVLMREPCRFDRNIDRCDRIRSRLHDSFGQQPIALGVGFDREAPGNTSTVCRCIHAVRRRPRGASIDPFGDRQAEKRTTGAVPLGRAPAPHAR